MFLRWFEVPVAGRLDAARHPLEQVAKTLPAALPTQRHIASRHPRKQELVCTVRGAVPRLEQPQARP